MIKYINRFENWNNSGEDLHIVFYKSGHSSSFMGWADLPMTARRFIVNAKNFEFCKSITGEFYHRFS